MYLSAALRQYEGHVRAKRLEPSTIKNRVQPLNRGLEIWGDLPLNQISPEHIDEMFTTNLYAARTQNLYIGALRQFFDWAHHTGLRTGPDPTYGWRARKVSSDDRLRIPVHQFQDLLDAAKHPRDRAVLAIGIYTFMRGSEIQLLRVNSVDFTAGVINMYRQKTKEQDNLPICLELGEELREYLDFYRRSKGDLWPGWYLTPAKNPDRWSRDGKTWVRSDRPSDLRPKCRLSHPYEIAKRAIKSLGYPDVKNEGIHTLRRSGSRALFDTLMDSGVDSALLRVGAMLGHKDTKITAHYIGLNMERDRRNKMLSGTQMFPTGDRRLKAVN